MKYQIEVSKLNEEKDKTKSIRLRPNLQIADLIYWQDRVKKLLPSYHVSSFVANGSEENNVE